MAVPVADLQECDVVGCVLMDACENPVTLLERDAIKDLHQRPDITFCSKFQSCLSYLNFSSQDQERVAEVRYFAREILQAFPPTDKSLLCTTVTCIQAAVALCRMAMLPGEQLSIIESSV